MTALTEKKIGFVTGCPRSGTTAFVRLLNTHPDIAATNERFSKRMGRDSHFTREHMTTDRFIDHRKDDCGPRAFFGPSTKIGVEKWAQSKVVVDKVPNAKAVFTTAKKIAADAVVAIVREPFGVARSFDNRAQKAKVGKDKSWTSQKDFTAGVKRFNASISDIDVAMSQSDRQRGFPLMVVDYNELFSDSGLHKDVFAFLGVDPEAALGADEVLQEMSEERRRDGKILEHVALNADFKTYRRVSKKTRRAKTEAFTNTQATLTALLGKLKSLAGGRGHIG